MPTLTVLMAFSAFRRIGEYAVTRPSREVLYTVVSREDKYKAKSFVDTFVFRAGDQIGVWTGTALTAAGLTLSGTSLVAAPIMGVWLVVALWLGRRQASLANERAVETPSGNPVHAAG